MAEADFSPKKESTELLSENTVVLLDGPNSVPTKQSSPEITPTCHFFLEGRCRFGAQCRNHHPGEIIDVNPVKESRPTCKSSQPLPVSKKPAMKTAEDVISRLLWDPQVPAECFSIGYLDRFLGVVEQPFTAFSWEDLASAGPGVLAIPKHRIQYFKYRTHVVWDKVSRTDDVFGSTGSGRTILEVIKEEEDRAIQEKSNSHLSNGDGRKEAIATGQGMDKQNAEEEHVRVFPGERHLNRTAVANDGVEETGEAMGSLKLMGDAHVSMEGNIVTQREETEAVRLATDRYSIKEEKMDKYFLSTEQEGEPLIGGNVAVESSAAGYFPCSKQRPTHFIAIPISSPEIREMVKLFQETLCEVRPDLAKFCVPLGTLHLTLGLLHLNTSDDIFKAVVALQELQANSQRLLPPALLLRFQRIETFHSHVLYMAPESVPELCLLAQTLEDAFNRKDLNVIHLPSKEKFHLTMVKIPPGKTSPQLPEDPSWIPTVEHLGTQAVETLCLCETGKSRRTDGFYSTVLKIDLY